MKITIDTREDSPEDMRKVIALLSTLIEGREKQHSNIFEDSASPSLESSEPSIGNAFANMFGSGSEKKAVDDGFVDISDIDKKSVKEAEETEDIKIVPY